MDLTKQNPHLDGLRGIAIITVIVYHYSTGLYIFDFGWMGVDLFFVLSGYLLTGRLYPFLDDKKIIWKFYLNRIIRIVPLYYLFLLSFFGGWFIFTSDITQQQFPIYKNYYLSFFGFFCNWVFILNSNFKHIHLSHLWSLCVEEQLYVLFPLLITIVKDKKILLVTGILMIFLSLFFRIFYFSHNIGENEKIYWNTFYRCDSFLLGFVLFMMIENGYKKNIQLHIRKVFVVTIAIVSLGLVFQGTMRIGEFVSTIGYTIIGIFFCCLIFFLESNEQNILKKITLNKILRFSGKISYGLFLFNWPIFILGFTLTNYFTKLLGYNLNEQSIQILNGFFSLILTYFISIISFKYYESFFMKFKMR